MTDTPPKYIVQYTHQKKQKNKRWSEGYILVKSKKVILYEDGTHNVLDSKFISNTDFEIDQQIETDGFLILIQELSTTTTNTPKPQKSLPPPPTKTAKVTSSITTATTSSTKKKFTVPVSKGGTTSTTQNNNRRERNVTYGNCVEEDRRLNSNISYPNATTANTVTSASAIPNGHCGGVVDDDDDDNFVQPQARKYTGFGFNREQPQQQHQQQHQQQQQQQQQQHPQPPPKQLQQLQQKEQTDQRQQHQQTQKQTNQYQQQQIHQIQQENHDEDEYVEDEEYLYLKQQQERIQLQMQAKQRMMEEQRERKRLQNQKSLEEDQQSLQQQHQLRHQELQQQTLMEQKNQSEQSNQRKSLLFPFGKLASSNQSESKPTPAPIITKVDHQDPPNVRPNSLLAILNKQSTLPAHPPPPPTSSVPFDNEDLEQEQENLASSNINDFFDMVESDNDTSGDNFYNDEKTIETNQIHKYQTTLPLTQQQVDKDYYGNNHDDDNFEHPETTTKVPIVPLRIQTKPSTKSIPNPIIEEKTKFNEDDLIYSDYDDFYDTGMAPTTTDITTTTTTTNKAPISLKLNKSLPTKSLNIPTKEDEIPFMDEEDDYDFDFGNEVGEQPVENITNSTTKKKSNTQITSKQSTSLNSKSNFTAPTKTTSTATVSLTGKRKEINYGNVSSTNQQNKSSKVQGFQSPSNTASTVKWDYDTIKFPDAKTAELLMLNAKKNGKSSVERQCTVHNYFNSFEEYMNNFVDAITEEIDIMLVELAHKFYQACLVLNSNEKSPPCLCQPKGQVSSVRRVIKSEGSKNQGKEFYTCRSRKCKFFRLIDEKKEPPPIVDSHSLTLSKEKLTKENEKYFQSAGVNIVFNVEFIIKDLQQQQQGYGDSFHQQLPQPTPQQPQYIYFIKLQEKRNFTYAKDDLWILSSSSNFGTNTFIVKSVFHSVSNINLLQVIPLYEELLPRLGRKTTLFAIHGPNISSELSMIDNLKSESFLSLPIHKFIMTGEQTPLSQDCKDIFFLDMTTQEAHNLLDHYINEYKLNQHQAQVLNQVFSWFNFSDSLPADLRKNVEPVLLVHGVFGSGKSTLLVIIILFINEICEKGQNDLVKVLVTSLTNVAVDRILMGLLEHQFKEFYRIGSVKRIAKPILRYTLHSGAGGGAGTSTSDDDLLRELRSMIKTESDDKSRQLLQLEIDDIESGTYNNRKTGLLNSRVIGTTCASSTSSLLAEITFPIVFLDECSQITEPLSLIPLCKSGCERVIAVGDPQQLEPTLHSKPSRQVIEAGGLEKTLYVRLSKLGVQPILLKTQYRCHPKISGLSNKLFYNNALYDGVSEESRSPLIPKLSPITLIESNVGSEQHDSSTGGFYNDAEANLIFTFIDILIRKGVKESQIGVICFYKAQAFKMSNAFKEKKKKEKIFEKETAVKDYDSYFGEPIETNDDDYENGSSTTNTATSKTHDGGFEDNLNILADGDDDFEHDEEQERKDAEGLKISTVDAFQGAERDIIIFSCTRTSTFAQGFLDNPQRLNVAITRAKNHFVIVGRSQLLSANPTWKTIIQSCQVTLNGSNISKNKTI